MSFIYFQRGIKSLCMSKCCKVMIRQALKVKFVKSALTCPINWRLYLKKKEAMWNNHCFLYRAGAPLARVWRVRPNPSILGEGFSNPPIFLNNTMRKIFYPEESSEMFLSVVTNEFAAKMDARKANFGDNKFIQKDHKEPPNPSIWNPRGAPEKWPHFYSVYLLRWQFVLLLIVYFENEPLEVGWYSFKTLISTVQSQI